MNSVPNDLPAWAQNAGLFLLDITVKTTLLLALTAAVAALSVRASAAWRHLVWMLGLIAVIGLPLLNGVLPPLTVSVPRMAAGFSRTEPLPEAATVKGGRPADFATTAIATEPWNAVPQVGNARASTGSRSLPSEVATPSTAVQPQSATGAGALSLLALLSLLLLWLIGTMAVLLQWLAGSAGLRRIFHATEDVPVTSRGKIAAAYRYADRSLSGSHRPVGLRVAAGPAVVSTPLTWGWLRPIIVLPADAAEWPQSRLEAAVLHELAHVERRDWPLQRLAHAICALFWFHPLVWLAARAARAESEKASDDLVLRAGIFPTVYADHLLLAARSLSCQPSFIRNPFAGGSSGQGAVAMVSPKMSGTEARLRAVLDTNRSRDSLSPRRRAAALLFAALIAAPLAVLAPVSGAGAQQDQQAPAAPARTGKPVPRTAGGFTQTISKDFLRAVSPGRNGSAGRVIEFDRAARDKAPARIVNGSRATLPNGYVVEVIGLNRLAARDGYWQSADPQAWQKPDGTLFKLPVLPHSTYQSGMPTDRTRGLAPVLVVTRITPPPGARRSGFSSVIQPLGTAQDVEYSWIVPHTRVFGPEDTVVNSFTYPLFPEDAKTFALKAGIATGPWTTRAVKPISFSPKTTGKISGAKSDREFRLLIKLDDSPAIEYVDRRGHWHADYFLPRGTRLGAEDRRVVAVDARGKTFPLEFGSLSGGLHQFGAPMSALSFSPSSDRRSPYHSPIGLAAVRELRLETRPFQRVEFRNLAIPPQTQAADTVTKAPDTATQAAPPVTVVIDAGHGGADSGATAKNAREKDINLAVARRLRDELAAAGIRVVMTRIDDTFIPITTRGDLAAREKAACFISIHCEPTGPNYSVSYHDNSSSGKRFADSIARQNAQAFGPASGKISSDTIRFANGYGILRKSSPVSAAVLVSCPGVAQMTSPEAQNRAARSFAAGIRDFVTSAH